MSDDMSRFGGVKRFALTVHALDNTPTGDDQDAARWVAQGLYGIYQGLKEAGSPRSADALLFAGAELVARLGSGAWREDVLRERLAAAPREVTS